MALGTGASPLTKATSTLAKAGKFNEDAAYGRTRRGSLPYSVLHTTGKPLIRPEKSWLVRRLANILRRSPTEVEEQEEMRNQNARENHGCCMKCRQAFDETVQLWTNEDECSVDPSNLYRQQLRVILQQDTLSEFSETDLAHLTRSLSEGDIRRESEDNNNEYFEDLIDRYGLMSEDYVETLCVPEGAIIGDDECYITSAFLESLDKTSSKSLASEDSTEQSSPVANRAKNIDNQRRGASLCSNDFKEEGNKVSEAVSRTHTFPQSKRRVSALLFDTLTRRLSRTSENDFKWKRDPKKIFTERAAWIISKGLPDHLSSALSTSGDFNDIESVNFELAETSKYNLNSPLWARFDLFSKEEYTSWHDKYRHDKMSSKLVKKQDAIYELILIEKAHCAHLAFLQQGYRNRLLQENVLPEADINRLIPDVLDALLVFHLHLLDRLTARQRESDEVETISDILAEELSDEGKHISIAINAYTTFGSAKERSEKLFESLMAKNGRFADFIRSTASDPLYRRFEFKSTMTRVISRPAKYGLLVETILKNEGNKFTKECELTQKALLAAKRFAMKIDNNLLMAQMAQRWDDVRSHFDHSSHTNLYLVDKEKPSGVVRITFTMEDLDMDMKHVGSGQRRLMCLGDVCMKNSSTKLVEKVFMVLFDDILVCLQRRSNQKYMFIQQEQSVFPVSGLILRPADRSASVMIISGAITKPALLEVEFNSKTDRTKWIKTLETAIHSAPVKEYKYKTNQETFFTGPL
ncbi:hypothetical protein RB195_006482 [Necator americanus]|uniref:DH domain-containing protein n=1 Tax=Necator americanus TaxID=51031 RepID=A0ABR1BVT4_NECAM